MDNAIRASNGTDIYTSEVYRLFDAYIDQFNNNDDHIKSTCFAGAMRFIYENLFKPNVPQPNNRKTILDTGDIETLDRLWSVYTSLCYRAGIRPTILRFSLMSGISMEAFNNWKRGDYRSNSPAHRETIKTWLSECESSIYDGILDNQVGAIFAAKADFQWREAGPVMPESYQIERHDTAEQIAQRHAEAHLPQPPVLELEGVTEP